MTNKQLTIALFMVGSVLGGVALVVSSYKKSSSGVVIVLNGPSGSGKSSIQKAFQQRMLPALWVKVGIDSLFDGVMPDINPENMHIWQSKNPIRWIETSRDASNKSVITLFVGEDGEKVAYAMNSAIAAYAAQGCNVIVDYIAYKQEWLKDLEEKLKPFKTCYVAVDIPLEILEQREAARGTSPVGHARSHYYAVYGDKKYDLRVNTEQESAKRIAEQLEQLVQR